MSLQWGAWAGSGMAAQEGPLLSRLARLGMGAIDPAQGLTALQAAMQGMLMSHQSVSHLMCYVIISDASQAHFHSINFCISSTPNGGS